MQSEPSEAMLQAGLDSTIDGQEIDFRAIYLAMKALDPDFATRTDSPTDAVDRAWETLRSAGNVSSDNTWLQCSRKDFIAALRNSDGETM